jgi:hypothetical protein
MRILIDGDTFSIVGHTPELLAISGLTQDGIKHRSNPRDGGRGASKHSVRISLELDSGAKRVWAAMSQETPDHVTLARTETSCEADNRTRALSVIEAAAETKLSPGHLWRLLRKKDPGLLLALIPDSDPLRFDRIAIKAWATGRPTRRRAA